MVLIKNIFSCCTLNIIFETVQQLKILLLLFLLYKYYNKAYTFVFI